LKSNPVCEARPVEQAAKHKRGARALMAKEALHIFELFDTHMIAVRQDLPDIARYLAGPATAP
jgi:hypothetical protein